MSVDAKSVDRTCAHSPISVINTMIGITLPLALFVLGKTRKSERYSLDRSNGEKENENSAFQNGFDLGRISLRFPSGLTTNEPKQSHAHANTNIAIKENKSAILRSTIEMGIIFVPWPTLGSFSRTWLNVGSLSRKKIRI